jgi:WD40 repeat protein
VTYCFAFVTHSSRQTGVCIRILDGHSEPITALAWLPDNSGFISSGLDRKIIFWVRDLFSSFFHFPGAYNMNRALMEKCEKVGQPYLYV